MFTLRICDAIPSYPEAAMGLRGDADGAHGVPIPWGVRADVRPPAVIVAEVEGRIVGFIEVILPSHAHDGDSADCAGLIQGWYVRPQYRRAGVGKELIAAAAEWIRLQAAERARVPVGFG